MAEIEGVTFLNTVVEYDGEGDASEGAADVSEPSIDPDGQEEAEGESPAGETMGFAGELDETDDGDASEGSADVSEVEPLEAEAGEESADEYFDETVADVSTICAVKEGDAVTVMNINGIPTVIGTTGWGDGIEDDVADALGMAEEALASAVSGITLTAKSDDEAATAAKTATLDEGQAWPESLDGKTVTVICSFRNGNTAAGPTLELEGSGLGPLPIITNGVNAAYWSIADGATEPAQIMLTLRNGAWYVASSPVYASEVIVGNEAGSHASIDASGMAVYDDKGKRRALFSETTVLGGGDGTRSVFATDGLYLARPGEEATAAFGVSADWDAEKKRLYILSSPSFERVRSLAIKADLIFTGQASDETYDQADIVVEAETSDGGTLKIVARRNGHRDPSGADGSSYWWLASVPEECTVTVRAEDNPSPILYARNEGTTPFARASMQMVTTSRPYEMMFIVTGDGDVYCSGICANKDASITRMDDNWFFFGYVTSSSKAVRACIPLPGFGWQSAVVLGTASYTIRGGSGSTMTGTTSTFDAVMVRNGGSMLYLEWTLGTAFGGGNNVAISGFISGLSVHLIGA